MNIKRIKYSFTACLIIFSLLGTRLLYISGVKGGNYAALSEKQQRKTLTVSSLRAEICDRNGIPFTGRETETVFFADSDGNEVYSFDIKRRFPALATHLTGYTSADGNGVCAVEKLLDKSLKGKGSIELSFNADASGEPIDGFSVKKIVTDNAEAVSLSLDYHIQKIAEQTMDKHIKKGAAVILDTKSFDVLAMVSRPDYDSDAIAEYKTSKNGELLNRAVLGYNAGSVFKIITAAAALESGLNYDSRLFDCRGSFSLKNTPSFNCHKEGGHGMINFDSALALSCNCAFYMIGLEAGADKIISSAKKFGMGSTVLAEAIGESGGNLPQRSIYTDAETLNLAIGQGEILITPLQCALMTAIIANGGVKKSVNIISDNQHISLNGEKFSAVSEQTAEKISQMMRYCVLYGTGKAAASSSVAIAGKTGSAQTGWIDGGKTLVHGWFCGFFPYENPKYAMAILSEGGESGAESCVAPFVEIAEEIQRIYPFE